MNEQEMEMTLADVLHEADGLDLARVVTFADAGIMTNNAGLVVRMKDGSEFQITIVQSR